MHVSKYLNQRLRRIAEENGKSIKFVSEARWKKKTPEKSFITQLKIEFLLPSTICRKVPVYGMYVCICFTSFSHDLLQRFL